MKRGRVFSFLNGSLSIKESGYGNENGWGTFAFSEKQIEFDADGYAEIEVPPSELREMRDFLNQLFPVAETCTQPSDDTR